MTYQLPKPVKGSRYVIGLDGSASGWYCNIEWIDSDDVTILHVDGYGDTPHRALSDATEMLVHEKRDQKIRL